MDAHAPPDRPAGNRERLERAALEAVARRGLAGLSFRTLADEIGVKSSSVHYHFPAKADLVGALIERYAGSFAGRLDEIAASSGPLHARIEAFVDLFDETGAAGRMCLCGMLAAETERLDESSRRRLGTWFEDTERWLETQFETSPHALATPLAPRALARALMSGLEGALLLDRTGRAGRHARLDAQRALALSWLAGTD